MKRVRVVIGVAVLVGLAGTLLSSCQSRTAIVPMSVGTKFNDVPIYFAYLDGLKPTSPDEVAVSFASVASIEGRAEVWTPERQEVRPYAAFTPGRYFVHPDTLAARFEAATDSLALFARDSMHISGGPGGIPVNTRPGARVLHIGTFADFLYSQAERGRLITNIRPGNARGVSYGIPGELLEERLAGFLDKMRVRAAAHGATRLVGVSLSMSGGRGLWLYGYAIAEDFGPPE